MRKFAFGMIYGVMVAGAGGALAQVLASVNTNGVLQGDTVQKDGKTV